jgi:hypothetical protein
MFPQLTRRHRIRWKSHVSYALLVVTRARDKHSASVRDGQDRCNGLNGFQTRTLRPLANVRLGPMGLAAVRGGCNQTAQRWSVGLFPRLEVTKPTRRLLKYAAPYPELHRKQYRQSVPRVGPKQHWAKASNAVTLGQSANHRC